MRIHFMAPGLALAAVAALIAAGCADPVGGPTGDPEGVLVGQVLDQESGTAIGGASIRTEPVTSSVQTGADGTFELPDVDPGEYVVHATAEGYESTSSDAVTITEGITKTVNLNMVAAVSWASTCQACHLQSERLQVSLAEDPLPDATHEGGSAGEG
ncbi:MAG: carboxypeptidase-like regulatory domain-containing protein [Myxococcota bacterium]